MKNIVVLLSLVATVSAYSQGSVNFLTRDTATGVNTLITYSAVLGGPLADLAKPSPTVATAHNGFLYGGIYARAGLYGGPQGTPESQLVLLAPAVPFRTGPAAGYVDPGSDAVRYLANVAPGAIATLQIRAWDTGSAGVDSYEAALALSGQGRYYGKSLTIAKALGGVGTPPSQPANLAGLANFSMVWAPEPSIFGLGIVGAVAALMFLRRRE